MTIEGAEMLKLVCNAFHALKVVFANEIGEVCRLSQVDGDEVMRVFVRDTQLNISPAYLQPGFAFGGPCLGKDVAALEGLGEESNLLLLRSIRTSNDAHIERAVQRIRKTGLSCIGLIGLAHKPGTGDLRDAPAVALRDRLVAEGFTVLAYDPSVSPTQCNYLVPTWGALLATGEVLVVIEPSYLPADPQLPTRKMLYLAPETDRRGIT